MPDVTFSAAALIAAHQKALADAAPKPAEPVPAKPASAPVKPPFYITVKP